MQSQSLLDRERLRAIVADVRYGTAVLAGHVVLQAASLPEAQPTVIALEGSLIGVNAQMLPQIVAVRKGFVADIAHMIGTARRLVDRLVPFVCWRFGRVGGRQMFTLRFCGLLRCFGRISAARPDAHCSGLL